MSLDTTTPSRQPTEDETQSSGGGGGRKTSTMKPTDQQQIIIKCPRCDSPNTKFCYYNNYSLTQPRHFCKTCRRYWTKGGALRNVPIGGGCRKNKKTRSTSLRFMNADSSSKDSSLDIGGLSLFSGLPPPAMDFQLAGLNQFPSSSNNPPPAFLNLDSLGLNFPLMNHNHQHHHQLHGGLPNFQEIGGTNNLASSIESLSSINQDLHWKLQQQRLAALFSGGGGGGGGGETDHEQQQQNQIVIDQSQSKKLQPILFHNLEIPKPSQASISMAGDLRKDGGGLETEWFFDNNYVDPTTAIAPADTNPSGNYQNGSINNWNNGIQVWNQFNQYSSLP